ncbi:hypothetical protein AKJ16_DCAP13105 [Drosera capensis]
MKRSGILEDERWFGSLVLMYADQEDLRDAEMTNTNLYSVVIIRVQIDQVNNDRVEGNGT